MMKLLNCLEHWKLMSIEHEHDGGFVAECDSCATTEFLDVDYFDEAVSELKELNWAMYKDRKGQWEHHCEPCILKKDFN